MPFALCCVCLFYFLATAISSAEQWALIPLGSSWKFQASGITPTNWPQTNFNDSAWLAGPAELQCVAKELGDDFADHPRVALNAGERIQSQVDRTAFHFDCGPRAVS